MAAEQTEIQQQFEEIVGNDTAFDNVQLSDLALFTQAGVEKLLSTSELSFGKQANILKLLKIFKEKGAESKNPQDTAPEPKANLQQEVSTEEYSGPAFISGTMILLLLKNLCHLEVRLHWSMSFKFDNLKSLQDCNFSPLIAP